jgi:VWA domain containing CoxE-like protein
MNGTTPRQLLAIRLAEAKGGTPHDADLFSEDYLLARPLLAALDHPGPRPAVLLIVGAALKEFNDLYGCRGLARGAVVLIISDGWETGDPALLGEQMARLSRVAHRIVWANPRTQSPRYRPEVGGMAAAWPYCDAVVSAHRLTALAELMAALADPGRPRRIAPSSGRAGLARN